MKVLLVTPGFPAPPTTGASQRAFHVLRLLARRHQVHLFSVGERTPVADALAMVEPWCSGITVVPASERSTAARLWDLVATADPDLARRMRGPRVRAGLERVLRQEDFDIVQVVGLELAGEVLGALSGLRLARPRFVLDAANAEFLLQRRAFLVDGATVRRWPAAAYSLIQWLKLRRYERAVCRRAASVLAVSEEDRRALLVLHPGGFVPLIPHGVDIDRYCPLPEPAANPGASELLFTGTMDYRPNVDAVTWFCREVFPRVRERLPDARFTIVGRNPTAAVRALEGSGVEVTGPVADDLPYYQRATAFVLPMRYGGGVRLKLLQALASGLPLVSTSMGAEGVMTRHNEHLLLANKPDAFADAAVQLLTDRSLAQRLALAGRALVEQRYSWEATGLALDAVYNELEERVERAAL